jgi:hypothetical protein
MLNFLQPVARIRFQKVRWSGFDGQGCEIKMQAPWELNNVGK